MHLTYYKMLGYKTLSTFSVVALNIILDCYHSLYVQYVQVKLTVE